MRSKKGVVEIQFNWMFVLIAGAIILALFIGIILRQKGISETTTNALILNNLDAVLSGSEVSVGTVNVVKMPEAKRFITSIKTACGVDKNKGLINFRLDKIAHTTKIMRGTIT